MINRIFIVTLIFFISILSHAEKKEDSGKEWKLYKAECKGGDSISLLDMVSFKDSFNLKTGKITGIVSTISGKHTGGECSANYSGLINISDSMAAIAITKMGSCKIGDNDLFTSFEPFLVFLEVEITGMGLKLTHRPKDQEGLYCGYNGVTHFYYQ